MITMSGVLTRIPMRILSDGTVEHELFQAFASLVITFLNDVNFKFFKNYESGK